MYVTDSGNNAIRHITPAPLDTPMSELENLPMDVLMATCANRQLFFKGKPQQQTLLRALALEIFRRQESNKIHNNAGDSGEQQESEDKENTPGSLNAVEELAKRSQTLQRRQAEDRSIPHLQTSQFFVIPQQYAHHHPLY